MRKFLLLCSIFFISMPLSSQTAKNQNNIETIVFVRHGERSALDIGQMNCQGFNRALSMPRVLYQKFGAPNYIFAPNPYGEVNNHHGAYYYVRGLATIEPTAIQFKLPVNTTIPFFAYATIAKELLQPKYHQSTIFLAWEHLNIPLAVRQLMDTLKADSKDVPHWKGKDFDSIYVVKIDWNKKPVYVEFVHDQQNLDHESAFCPARSPSTIQKGFERKIVLIPAVESELTVENQISCRGLNRAIGLLRLIRNSFSGFDFFIIPPIKSGQSQAEYLKPLMTLEPTVIDQGKTFLAMQQDDDVEAHIFHDRQLANANLIIAWPHKEVTQLAKDIFEQYGGDPAIIPRVSDHDSIYQITIDLWGKKPPVYTEISQDMGKLSDLCPKSL